MTTIAFLETTCIIDRTAEMVCDDSPYYRNDPLQLNYNFANSGVFLHRLGCEYISIPKTTQVGCVTLFVKEVPREF